MKKIFMSFLAVSSMLLLVLSSCKKDENKITAGVNGVGTLSASTTSPALSEATANDNAVTFSWSAAKVTGYQTGISYSIQIDKKGNNFAAPREIAAALPSSSVTNVDMNTTLINLGLPVDVAAQVEVRVKAVLAVNGTPSYSNVLTMNVTPYNMLPKLYLPGDYQGWDPTSTSVKFIVSKNKDANYEGTITFASAATFKFTTGRSWNVNYGTSDTAGKLVSNGGNVTLAAGTYTIKVNTTTLAYSIVPQ